MKDDLARVKGVGDVTFLGPRDYSMRVWLDPQKLASLGMTAADVIKAIREQNVQVAAGRLGQPPVAAGEAVPFQLVIKTQGRLSSEQQFDDIIVKTGSKGEVVKLRDVVRKVKRDEHGRIVEKGTELGAKNYDVNSYLDGDPSVTLAVFQLPGSNALKTADEIKAKMKELKSQVSQGRGLQDRLRHDGLHRRIGPRGVQDPLRGVHSGLHRRAGLPPGLAGDADAHDRRAGLADRHVRA